jgi:hypothetical protein
LRENENEPIILSYKDAHLKSVIKSDDFLKFLEDPSLKENLDACLNDIR